MPLSPAAAAKIAGVSRSLISKAVKSGELVGSRNNRGHIQINRADLDNWMSRRTMRAKAEPEAAPDANQDSDQTARIASLETEVKEVRARLDDALADRYAWRAQAERLAETRQPVIHPVGIFGRIFGRGRGRS